MEFTEEIGTKKLGLSRPGLSALLGMVSSIAVAMAAPLATAQELGEVEGASQSEGEETSSDGTSFEIDTIVVTGSRISRPGFDSAASTAVVSQDEIRSSGFVNIDDVLVRQPALTVGLGSQNSYRAGDAGAALVNLRGLGSNRTLVLIDGRRRVSGSRASSAVDLNSLPSAMIERVEILTGGVSAVYGADAVSGVVNIITKSDFEGLEIEAKGGMSGHSDAETYSVSAFGGTSFDDEGGHINFAINYSGQEALLMEERAFGLNRVRYRANPENTGSSDGIPDQFTAIDYAATYVTESPNFYLDGTTYMVDTQAITPVECDTFLRVSSLGNGVNCNTGANAHDHILLRTPTEAFSVRTDVSRELNDYITFFAEGEFSNVKSEGFTAPYRYDERAIFFGGRGGPVITRDNAFLPDHLASFMDENGLTEVSVREKMSAELGFLENKHERTTYTAVAGFEGEFDNGWQWNVFYQYGNYKDNIENTNLLIHEKFVNSVDVILDPSTGQVVCRDEAARADGCIPHNVFESVAVTDAYRDYAVHTRLQTVGNTQQVFGGQLVGDVFELPAGAIKFALGAEYREEALVTMDDGLSLSGDVTYLGLASPRAPLDEKFDVKEGFVEVLVPLIADQPFAEQIDFEGAVRISDYNTIGSTTAWRAGLSWRVSNEIAFRGNLARSVRAPNLFELFAPRNTTIRNFLDPCDATRIDESANRAANCAALGFPAGFVDSFDTTLVVSGGNPNLQEEVSDSLTLGLTWTPSFAEGFSLSIDYYDIQIEDAVSSFGAEEIADRCFDASSVDNPFCGVITIGPDFNLDQIEQVAINVASYVTSGLDFEIGYDFPETSFGNFRLNAVGTYLLKKEFLVVPDDEETLIIEDGRYTDPRFRLNTTVSWEHGDWTTSLAARYINQSIIDPQASEERFDNDTVDARLYADVRVGYSFSENMSVFVGVNNLTDIDPPFTPITYFGGQAPDGEGSAGLYDNIGRYFFTGVRAKF